MNKRGSFYVAFLIIGVVIVIALALLYISVSSTKAKIATAIGIGIVGMTIFWDLYMTLFSSSRKLRKLLGETTPLLQKASTNDLKSRYMKIYVLYMKLSESEKQNFYADVEMIRETIESQLQSEKQLEIMLREGLSGGMRERREQYGHILDIYNKLPSDVKKKFYANIAHLKEAM